MLKPNYILPGATLEWLLNHLANVPYLHSVQPIEVLKRLEPLPDAPATKKRPSKAKPAEPSAAA